jgi:hypothetical protein
VPVFTLFLVDDHIWAVALCEWAITWMSCAQAGSTVDKYHSESRLYPVARGKAEGGLFISHPHNGVTLTAGPTDWSGAGNKFYLQ